MAPVPRQQTPLGARDAGVVVEQVGFQARLPGELAGRGGLGHAYADDGGRGQVDLLLLLGQRLEVPDVLLVAGPVKGNHDRPPHGPHAQPELPALGARQVELRGLGPHLRRGDVSLASRKHPFLLARTNL